MNYSNQVILCGQMSLIQVSNIKTVRNEMALSVVTRLTTDLWFFGGYHRVLCESDLALETLAFEIVSRLNNEPVKALVDGWLWSADERAHVVAREIAFYVPPLLREQAVIVLRQLRKHKYLPEEVMLNGSQVNVREILADVDGLDGRTVAV
jgi:2-succinyl-5-enolpyruvyl-6-hydroxy-3-cyclohexene-1-carboxylate synthase